MRTVKAAAVQLSPVLYSREGTVDKVVRTIHELGKEGNLRCRQRLSTQTD
jgi:nitrilase